MNRTTNGRAALGMKVGAKCCRGGAPENTNHFFGGSTNTSALTFPGHAVTDFSKIGNSILFDYSNCKVAKAKLRKVWGL